MKNLVPVLFVLMSFSVNGKDINTDYKILKNAFNKIEYWAFDSIALSNESHNDSLEISNDMFERLLLNFTKQYPKSISMMFKEMTDDGLKIVTSEDGLFRIYSWNTETGGSMRFFRNIYQYKVGNKVASQVAKSDDEGDPMSFYYKINDVMSKNKTFYITQSISVLGSNLYYYELKIFTIYKSTLNDSAKLIKTTSGLQNSIGYEVDLGAIVNHKLRDSNIRSYEIQYNQDKKQIIIPVILENGQVTNKKIIYQFNKQYFEKLK